MRERWQTVYRRMDGYMERLERLRLPEYIRYIEDRRRFMLMQFLGGLARGLGMAVGFTILGAVLVLVLQSLAQHNLPVIGDFLAEIVTIVQRRLE